MPYEFQLYDWMEDHETEEVDSDDEESEEEKDKNLHYIIHTFGRTMDGKSVYMKIVNYTPYFYIKLPEKWKKSEAKGKINQIFNYLTSNMNKKVWKKFRSCLINMDVVEKMTPEGFTNGKKFLFGRLIFNNSYAMKKFRYLFEQSKIYIPGVLYKAYQFKTYEANLPPMLRCFHIMKVKGCGWVSVSKYNELFDDDKESYCDIELRVDWRNVKSIEKEVNAPLRILSFDIECNSIDGEFPQAKRPGNAVIQIGSTYTYLGESLPYRQHIVCLNDTDNVPEAIVESYQTEEEMMEGWIKEIIRSDCDIITGYNIFYFDEAYIYDRCNEQLNMLHRITKISKLKEYTCQYKDFKLASSALGENRIKMFDTPGRVHIDLMKDVQKTFKLSSYKLDFVSSMFIRDNILKIDVKGDYCDLHCKGINDIYENDFIHIELVLAYVTDFIGKKYEIIKMDKENKILTIKMDDDLREQIKNPKPGKLFWSQAKDDVGPKDIFRLYRGSSKDRAIVAKYCVKDCRLVNLLINKLQVVTKNIEMANVCYVPLSYLFTRGQGIKLFSFCLKVYRDEGYVYPVLTKPEEKTPSYEGAIVFDPEPSVTYEALGVKDYASLYPSSMIHKNMSDETIVLDSKYDNLPGVEYFNSKFREYDGSIQYRRFAKVNGELGIIPKILQTLLGERKKVKKQMKVEKDDFKKEILDAKQLALKVTANSLYGSKGADTSQVRNRDIAACTTSTGREMLIFAKKYDEEIIPGFINGIKKAYLEGDNEMAENIMKFELGDNYNEDIMNKIKKYVTEDIKDYTFQPIIRYGDSIPGCEKVLINYNNRFVYFTMNQIIEKFVSISDRFNDKFKDNNGKYNYVPNKTIYSYTDSGLTKINYIIEHYYEGNFYTIYTQSSNVTVTSNHGCILDNGQIVTPKQLSIGDKLLTNNYTKDSGIITNIKEIVNNNSCLVYDFETENHHFAAGDGNLVVHNTDSIFSCYRYRENTTKVGKKESLQLWKDIIEHSETLMLDFIPEEYRPLWEFNHKEYYSPDDITRLRLPEGPETLPEPTHYKTILPVEERMKQFLKEYMEESYLPWLWTLQDIFNKDYRTEKIYNEILEVKLFRMGTEQVEKMRMIPIEIENKEYIINKHKKFIETKLKDYIVQPYWYIKNGKKKFGVEFYKGGEKITDKRSLTLTIDMGVITGETVKCRLPFPHDLEYEKTFWPYLILTKKRYVGNKYEFDPEKYKQDYNGIVLKRRDNAPIVKEVCGGIINCLINDKDPQKAEKYTIECLNKMFNGHYNIKYFLTSKTLKMKESYSDWTSQGHVVLADRINIRDPGNCPQSGDRISFAYIKIPYVSKDTKQGERIETPEFITSNNLELDYNMYMTNQIMKPALQFLDLVLPDARESIFKPYLDKFKEEQEIAKLKKENEEIGRTDVMNFGFIKIN